MLKKDFLNTFAPLITKYCKEFKYPFVSPILAQAILESNWGESYKAKIGNNFFGLKYNNASRVPSASGYFFDGGSEQKPDGSYVLLSGNSKWCKFENIEKGVKGYFEFLINGYGRYDKLPEAITPRDYLEKIKQAGYATSLNYVDNLMRVIETNNLTQYDKVTPQNDGKIKEKTPQNDGLKIISKINTHNLTPIADRKIEWIVLHYTAGTSSAAGAAQNTALWFANPTCAGSADFIVDDAQIVKYNPDPLKYYSWAVGGNKYSSMSTSQGGKYYGVVKNSNSISIEMCSNKMNKSSLKATDTDWLISNNTVQQAVKLTKFLMQQYNIKADHVVMHHHVTGKICPNPWCVNESALTQWNEFLSQIGNIPTIMTIPVAVAQPKNPEPSSPQPFLVKVLVSDLNIRKSPNGKKLNKYTGKGIFTIIEEKNGWGLLKSYAKSRNGWIYLNNRTYVERI